MMRASSVCALVLWVTVILGCSSVAEQGAPVSTERFYECLARHYAPVIHQGAVSEQDYITAFDFDGDWIGNNNWENMPYFELRAYVYYTAIESKTHWFLFYSLFHPRDYTYEDCATSGGCHENDLESIQLTVEKDGTPFGRLKVLETLAHQSIYLYTLDDTVGGNFLKIREAVELEEDHPVVYVEALGHGIYGHKLTSRIHLYLGGVVTYRVGEQAEVPESTKDENVLYELVPIYETLWQRRAEMGDGESFDKPFKYRGCMLPKSIDGEDFGSDSANTPWGYNQATGSFLSRGDWFLDPAKALAYHATFSGDFSSEYVHNPYLADLGLMGE